jgi:hypothetical protein
VALAQHLGAHQHVDATRLDVGQQSWPVLAAAAPPSRSTPRDAGARAAGACKQGLDALLSPAPPACRSGLPHSGQSPGHDVLGAAVVAAQAGADWLMQHEVRAATPAVGQPAAVAAQRRRVAAPA